MYQSSQNGQEVLVKLLVLSLTPHSVVKIFLSCRSAFVTQLCSGANVGDYFFSQHMIL